MVIVSLLGTLFLVGCRAVNIQRNVSQDEPEASGKSALYDKSDSPTMEDDVSDAGRQSADVAEGLASSATNGAVISGAGHEIQPWQIPLVRSARIHHTLRICNAYPYAKPMNIFLNEVELYGDMQYKECDDFVNINLVPGDILRFKTEVDHHQHSAGLFEMAELPHYSATLLLVISRHDTLSNAVRFESHVFKDSDNAQVAVVDTYHGRDRARIRVMHPSHVHDSHAASESLPFGSVHRINSGIYDIVMDEMLGPQDNLKKRLIALPTHNYVVMRVGVEDGPEEGDQINSRLPGDEIFPEDMIVFPLSKEERLKGHTVRIFGFSVVYAVIILWSYFV